MHIEKKTLRYLFFAAAGCVVLYWVLHETERFKTLWTLLVGILSPFVVGSCIAFVVNVPMRAIERHLHFIQRDGLRRTAAIVLTLVAFVFIATGVVDLLVPQITETIQSLIPRLVEFFLRVEQGLREFLTENPELLEWVRGNTSLAGLESIDWTGLIEKAVNLVKDSVTVIAGRAFTAVGGITSAVFDLIISLVFAFYCLARKEILSRQGRQLCYALLPEHWADRIIQVMRLTNSTFSNFISGQCLEAVILGCLLAVVMALFKMPYIPLISVLIAVTALVPLVGGFVGCFLGTFFILVNDPVQALIFVAVFLVLQQSEGNLIYPKVVGTSIGLPGMWVLLAVTVGGDLMGVAGMLIMIPIASVFYALLREFVQKRIAEKGIAPEKLQAQPPELKSKFKEQREKRKLLRQTRDLTGKRKPAQDSENNEE